MVDDHLELFDLPLGMDDEIPGVEEYRNDLEGDMKFVNWLSNLLDQEHHH